jgi:hypothetical protein
MLRNNYNCAHGTAMWTSSSQSIDKQTLKYFVNDGSHIMTCGDVIGSWQHDAKFRKFFSANLREAPFDAFFWETPPMTVRNLDRSFEFVLTQSETLSRVKADPSPFSTHFSSRQSEAVLTFPNLGGDAMLVVPAPVAEMTCYTHLARFLRYAPDPQVDLFWQKVGTAMQQRLSNPPTWLSTAGLGVSWLHLRLDSRPKYYRHVAYKEG